MCVCICVCVCVCMCVCMCVCVCILNINIYTIIHILCVCKQCIKYTYLGCYKLVVTRTCKHASVICSVYVTDKLSFLLKAWIEGYFTKLSKYVITINIDRVRKELFHSCATKIQSQRVSMCYLIMLLKTSEKYL